MEADGMDERAGVGMLLGVTGTTPDYKLYKQGTEPGTSVSLARGMYKLLGITI